MTGDEWVASRDGLVIHYWHGNLRSCYTSSDFANWFISIPDVRKYDGLLTRLYIGWGRVNSSFWFMYYSHSPGKAWTQDSLSVQLGTPFNRSMDLRSAPCIGLSDFSNTNDVYGDISWPARSPELSVCHFFLWGYWKRWVFQTRSADLHSLKLGISEERNAISPVMSA